MVVPKPPTRQTLSYGTVHGPEFASPLKICLGTYIEAGGGRRPIVTTGGVGPCRAGLYATVQREILRSLGYEFEMIVLEPLRRHPARLLRAIHRLNAKRLPPWRLASEALLCWQKIQGIDRVQRELLRIRPREVRFGGADRIFRRGVTITEARRDGSG